MGEQLLPVRMATSFKIAETYDLIDVGIYMNLMSSKHFGLGGLDKMVHTSIGRPGATILLSCFSVFL